MAPGTAYDVYVIDPRGSGVDQISNILQQYHHDLDAVHLITHGESGGILIGGSWLDNAGLDDHAATITHWGDALAPYGDLLLYGCDVAAGASGASFVNQLHLLTGADVAASIDATGGTAAGGNYVLEAAVGEVGSAPLLRADEPDAWSGLLSNFTVKNNKDSGGESLRDAIMKANASAGLNTIVFDIDGTGTQTISLKSALPALTSAVVIDATTQPGYAGSPLIILDGSAAGAGAIGLHLQGGASIIRGFSIGGFDGDGILIDTADGNTLEANYLGVDATGSAAFANGAGIEIRSNNNTVGGSSVGQGNLISGNLGYGVGLNSGASGNVIQGNLIGTKVDGLSALANGTAGYQAGIEFDSGAANNQIGGAGPGDIRHDANRADHRDRRPHRLRMRPPLRGGGLRRRRP